MPDYQQIKQELEGIAVEDNPALVKQKSRDFYWYSPILKAQLDYRHMPCNFVEIMPRLDEHLRRGKS